MHPDELTTLLRGELTLVSRMPSSSNATFLAEVRDGAASARVIYKPMRGERPLWDFAPGLHRREVAAYRLSEAMGLGVVPPTVLRDGPHGEGSVQLLVDADEEQHYFTLHEARPELHDALRAICNLYSESIHLVVRKGSGIRTVADLRGKRVSLDEPGSGTLVDARLILSAYGLKEADLQASYLPAQRVSDSLKAGNIDAFFSVSGWPQSAVAELAATVGIELVPIAGPQAEALIKQYAFFSADEIPDLAYKGVEGVKTVGVHALWVTSSKQTDDLIYRVTDALWNASTRKLLDSGHAKGRDIRLETALSGIGIPLHPGAEKFYKEKGLIK